MKCILVLSLFLLSLPGCSSEKRLAYEEFIKNEFINSENFRIKGSRKVEISPVVINQTKEQFIVESSYEIDADTLVGFELVDYQVTYSGSYWLETYQVFRYCNKSGCSHKFLLILGVYA